ncbi:MAG: GNAT family N-acetyltransferase [Opitutaceae bacterium]
MERLLGPATLRTGEVADAAVIEAPDPDWAERIERMLRHKGDPWNWQNSELLRRPCGLAARFFILHRAGIPFSNIMLAEDAGVALLGHVWTEPADRGGGASSLLMRAALDDFEGRGGRAIFLGTEFDSEPWRYYRRRGFEAVEPGSGYMARYGESAEEFERAWFGGAQALVEPLDWTHWPAAAPLCLGGFPGLVRLAAGQLIGRISSEGALLPLIRDARRRRESCQGGGPVVLRDAAGPAVLGIASRLPHPLWPDTDIVDLFCHPRWWPRAADLLAAIPNAGARRAVAFADAGEPARRAALESAGFRGIAVLPAWVRRAASGAEMADVAMLVRG